MRRVERLAAGALIMLAACGGPAGVESAPATASGVPDSTPVASPSPSTSQLPSTPATSQPSARPTAAPSPDLVMQVLVTDLVMRTAPGVGADSEIMDTVLSAPQLVYLFEGPVAADGYEWYRAAPFRIDDPTSSWLSGWIAAASREGEPWLAPAGWDCPAPTIADVVARARLANLVCYGGDEVTLVGTFYSCAAVDPVLLTPGWMLDGCWMTAPGAEGRTLHDPGTLAFAMPPDVDPPATDCDGCEVQLTGRWDDARASTCFYPPSEYFDPLPDVAEAVLWCRATFVAEAISHVTATQ